MEGIVTKWKKSLTIMEGIGIKWKEIANEWKPSLTDGRYC